MDLEPTNQTEKQKLMVNQILERKVISFLAQKRIKNHRLIAENIFDQTPSTRTSGDSHKHTNKQKAVIFYVHQRNQQLGYKNMFNHHPIAKDLPENTHTNKRRKQSKTTTNQKTRCRKQST